MTPERLSVLLTAAIALLLLAVLFPLPVHAQPLCGDRDDIVSRLDNGYQEHVTALGISGTGGVVELFTSEKGSWTLLMTHPGGVSCLIAAGDSWETLPVPVKGEGT